MRDVVVLAVTALFFALCVAYVRWCDQIIGPDPDGLRDDDGAANPLEMPDSATLDVCGTNPAAYVSSSGNRP